VLELPGLRRGSRCPSRQEERLLSLRESRRSKWTRAGDRLFFGWRQADDTTDVFAFRTGFGPPRD